MREIKRKLALLLTVCMVLNMVVPANGEEAAVSEEIAAQQEMTIEDVEITDYEEASPAYAAYDDSDAEEVSEASSDGAEYADKVFIRETVVDG